MVSNLSTKNKTMLFVAVVLILFSITLYSVIYYNQKEELKLQERQYYKSMTASYIKVLERHKEFYENRIKANIRSAGVKEALFNLERQKLYELSLGRWNTLSRENKYLRVMHFHLPNGESFLRMHEPEKYGDKIAQKRPMVAKLHKIQEPLSGFEAGIYNLAYRVFLPIFYNDKYIGALEFGSRPDQILSEMKYFNGLNGALFVQNDKLGLYKEESSIEVGGYTLQYDTMEEKSILQAIPKEYDFSQSYKLAVDNKVYQLYSFDLLDFENKSAAKVIFFSDITMQENKFVDTALKLFGVLGVLLVALLVVINYGFNKIITILDETNEKLTINTNFMESILDNTAHSIIVTDTKGIVSKFNKKAQDMLGYSLQEVVSQKNITSFHKKENFASFFEEANSTLEMNRECIYITKDHQEIPVKVYLTALRDADGEISGYIFIGEDITELKRSQKQIHDYMQLIDENIITANTDLHANFISVSQALSAISGYKKKELVGINYALLRHKDTSDDTYQKMLHAMEKNETYRVEMKHLKKDGGYFWLDTVIYPLFDERDVKTGYTFIMQDITNKKLVEEISITDGLTGIYNRRHFNNTFSKMIDSAKRKNDFLSFMILDIDYFKQYNDTYGHQKGDEALIKVAQVIRDSLKRADDYCFRLGGEEFGVIFKVRNHEEALAIATRIKNNIENLKIIHKDNTTSKYLTASIGLVSKFAQDMHGDDLVFKEADDLLYDAKKAGRNTIETNE